MDNGTMGFILGILTSTMGASALFARLITPEDTKVGHTQAEPIVWSEFESEAIAYSVKTQVDGLQRSDTDCRTIQTAHALSVQCSNGLQVFIRDTRPEIEPVEGLEDERP